VIAARQETVSHSLSAQAEAVTSVPFKKSKTRSLLFWAVEGIWTFQTNFFQDLAYKGRRLQSPKRSWIPYKIWRFPTCPYSPSYISFRYT